MIDRRTELMREDDAGWAELHELLGRLSDDDVLIVGYTPEWSVKDMLGHMACWWAEASSELERIRMGTYEAQKRDVDALNASFFEAMKDLDLHTISAELHASRNRALEELGRLPELTPAADEWFYESGPCHYGEHLPDLRLFVQKLSSG